MTDTLQSVPRFAESEFRVGRVFSRTFAVLSRNLLPFSLVTAVASVPNLLILTFQNGDAKIAPVNGGAAAGRFAFIFVLAIVLYGLSQATLLYAAFEDMRGRRVDLLELDEDRLTPISRHLGCDDQYGDFGYVRHHTLDRSWFYRVLDYIRCHASVRC